MRVSSCMTATIGAALASAQSNITCQSGVHVIVARASLEPAGFGILGPVKDMILSQIPSSDAIAVPYPATLSGNIPYPTSEQEGFGNMTDLVTQYGDACPSSKMVLMGYSQGAQVVGDVLIGVDYATTIFGKSPGVDQKYVDNVVAVVMMGDPANVAGQPFLHGNSTRSGYFPRNNTADWVSRGLVDKMISYCDANDTFCDSGNSLAVHIGYIGEYGTQAAAFVVDKANASNSSSASGSSTMSATGSATPTGGAGMTASASPTGTASANPTGTAMSASPTGPAASTTSPGTGGASSLQPGYLLYVLTGLLEVALIFKAIL